MNPVEVIEGKVSVLDRADVDTDQIIPKQFLKRIERSGFGEFLFYDWMGQADFPLMWPEFHGAPMPYSEFFYGGEAVHGSGTMVNPLSGHSHGCINMYIEDAAEFWRLTAPFRNTVTVYGHWA